jgi:carbon monoxide dehydrogenase subunit G
MPRFRLTSRMQVDRPLTDVWTFLTDFPRVASWERGVLEVRQTSPGPAGVGTTLAVRRVYFGRETRVECRITHWEELKGVTMELRGGPLRRASVRYAIEPIGSQQTEVIYTGEGELRRALQILTPFMPMLGRADERKNLAKLKQLLETPNLGARDAAAL